MSKIIQMATKQMIVMAKYLNMRKGKMISQGSHASVAAIINDGFSGNLGSVVTNMAKYKPDQAFFVIPMDDEMEHWMTGSFKKICQGINNEADLIKLYNDAKESGVRASLIVDSGLTEFNGVPTITAVGLGPNEDSRIDALTGKESELFLSGKLSLL